MKKILLAVFCLGVFLSYFFAFKAGDKGVAVSFGRTGPPFSAAEKLPFYPGPAGPGVAPGKTAAGAKRKVRRRAAVKAEAGLKEMAAALKKNGHRRKKRISSLRDPGEAMGGEAYSGVSTGTTRLARQNK
ncbi:MAG: hypothetical protein NTY45_15965 [Elusimicrobia bacterium]|nr:hypothetical protein [Elusimicrobiota bacterium]